MCLTGLTHLWTHRTVVLREVLGDVKEFEVTLLLSKNVEPEINDVTTGKVRTWASVVFLHNYSSGCIWVKRVTSLVAFG